MSFLCGIFPSVTEISFPIYTVEPSQASDAKGLNDLWSQSGLLIRIIRVYLEEAEAESTYLMQHLLCPLLVKEKTLSCNESRKAYKMFALQPETPLPPFSRY